MAEQPDDDLVRRAYAAARARRPRFRGGNGAADGTSAARRSQRTRWSGPGPDVRDPQPVGTVLPAAVQRLAPAGVLVKARLFDQWSSIVGTAIAEHSTPIDLVDGELRLECDSTAWATQLRLMAPQMITRINAAVGRGSVKRISARGPAAPSWRFGPRHVPGRGPRDTYG